MAVVVTAGVAVLDSLAFATYELVRGGLRAALQNLLALLTGAPTLVAGTHRILALLGG